jgi:hypothetical protein
MKYCFDIDGTICTNTNGEYEKAIPFKERILKINELFDDGHKIIFNTARGMGGGKGGEYWRDLTVNQLDDWGVKYHHLFMLKPSSDFYIDDKGINDEEFFRN